MKTDRIRNIIIKAADILKTEVSVNRSATIGGLYTELYIPRCRCKVGLDYNIEKDVAILSSNIFKNSFKLKGNKIDEYFLTFMAILNGSLDRKTYTVRTEVIDNIIDNISQINRLTEINKITEMYISMANYLVCNDNKVYFKENRQIKNYFYLMLNVKNKVVYKTIEFEVTKVVLNLIQGRGIDRDQKLRYSHIKITRNGGRAKIGVYLRDDYYNSPMRYVNSPYYLEVPIKVGETINNTGILNEYLVKSEGFMR